MRGGTVVTEDQEDGKSPLNKIKGDPEPLKMNRGIELLLRNKRRKRPKPKTFQMKFGNMFSFLKKEIHFYFEFHVDIINKISHEEE